MELVQLDDDDDALPAEDITNKENSCATSDVFNGVEDSKENSIQEQAVEPVDLVVEDSNKENVNGLEVKI